MISSRSSASPSRSPSNSRASRLVSPSQRSAPTSVGPSSVSTAHDSWLAGAVSRCQKIDPEFPRVTAHDLRHTAASLAVSSGANVKAVQKMLGHASAAMTLDVYADLFDDDLTAVADRLDERVGKMWAETGQRPDRKTGTDR